MVRIILLLTALSVCPGIARAQQHISVEPSRVKLDNGEFLPRYARSLPDSKTIPAGETVTLPTGESTWGAIEVGGTLEIPPGSIVRAVVIYVLPGGKIIGRGTCDVPSKIVFLSRPINTADDPFQWGHGLINFGRREFSGCRLGETWTLLTQDDVPADATSLRFAVPDGWRVGDEILIPDTAPAQVPDWTTKLNPPRRDPLRIAGIAADRQSITLVQPTGFERKPVRNLVTGAIVARVPVANVTRRGFTVTSDNPAGVAGHVADVGHEASFKSESVGYVGLGRTTIATLDSTPIDRSRIGAQQQGRYSGHCHHCDGSKSSSVGDLFNRGGAPGKWGFALHGGSDFVMRWPVFVDLPGAGFVTEDGNETRWTLDHAFMAYLDPGAESTSTGSPQANVMTRPGAEGTGIWLKGLKNATITDTQVWNARFGMSLMPHFGLRNLQYPSRPGGPRDTPLNTLAPTNVWTQFARITLGANRTMGLDYWGVRNGPIDDLITVHNYISQVGAGPEVGSIWLRRLVAIGASNECVASPKPYIEDFTLADATVQGCAVALAGGLGRKGVDIRRSNLHAMSLCVDFEFLPDGGSRLDAVVCHAPNAIRFGRNLPLWQPGQPIPGGYSGPHSGGQHVLIDWQRSGQSYRLFERQQARGNPSWQTTAPREIGCPEPGLTIGQCWDRYGLAWRGAVYDPAQAVHVPGVIGGVGLPGADGPIGPKRFIVTQPMRLQVLPASGLNQFQIVGAFVGDRALPTVTYDGLFYRAFDAVRVQVDGGPIQTVSPYMGGLGAMGMGYFTLPGPTPTSQGAHMIKTWRVENGAVVPNSEATTTYVIGTPSAEGAGEPHARSLDRAALERQRGNEVGPELTRTRTREISTPAAK